MGLANITAEIIMTATLMIILAIAMIGGVKYVLSTGTLSETTTAVALIVFCAEMLIILTIIYWKTVPEIANDITEYQTKTQAETAAPE